MSKVGNQLGGALRDLGEGYSIVPGDLPEEAFALYDAFDAGLIVSESPEKIPQNAAAHALDMEVNRRGRLVRSPGLTLVEDATPHSLRWTFEQASLDFSTELVTIDPPYIGFKGALGYTWVNVGLPATNDFGWTAFNAAGDLIFSNGVNKTYIRAPGASVVTDISAHIIARSFALMFGRMFAGAVTEGGFYDGLGLKWNAVTGMGSDWTGPGAGGELLLADLSDADRIVALHSLGFDLLAILCRNSLWAGHPTGDPERPADPRLRFPGFGCAARRTVESTPDGVTFLGDDGVISTNINKAWVISEPINGLLLPIDYARLDDYTAAYLQHSKRYVLGTPLGTFVYDFPIEPAGGHPGRKARWFHRSAVPDALVVWAEQSGIVSWDQLVGSWDEQTLTWDELTQLQSDIPSRLHLIKGTKLGREDYSSFDNFGESLDPTWETPNNDKIDALREWSTVGFAITYYSNGPVSLALAGSDHLGEVGALNVKALPNTNGRVRSYFVGHNSTGAGAKCQIQILSGQPEIINIKQILMDSGPSMQAI